MDKMTLKTVSAPWGLKGRTSEEWAEAVLDAMHSEADELGLDLDEPTEALWLLRDRIATRAARALTEAGWPHVTTIATTEGVAFGTGVVDIHAYLLPNEAAVVEA